MKVLVTGGAGFIGSALVRALCASGHTVRVLDDFSTGNRERLEGLPVELLAADVRNAKAVRRAIDGAQVVFHLAGLRAPRPGRGDILHAQEVNLGGLVNLLEAAAEARPRRVVLASSGSVYGCSDAYVLQEDRAPQPCTPDAVQRLATEEYATVYHLERGLPVVMLRLFRAFGPGERWDGDDVPIVPRLCRAALLGTPLPLRGGGRQTRDFLFIDNVVGGLLAAAGARGVEGRVYNIASGESVTVAQVWQVIASLAAIEVDAIPIEEEPLPVTEPAQVRVSIARARRDLGYAPTVLLREGLRRTVVHYREQLRAAPQGWFSPRDPTPVAVSPAGSWPASASALSPLPRPMFASSASGRTTSVATPLPLSPFHGPAPGADRERTPPPRRPPPPPPPPPRMLSLRSLVGGRGGSTLGANGTPPPRAPGAARDAHPHEPARTDDRTDDRADETLAGARPPQADTSPPRGSTAGAPVDADEGLDELDIEWAPVPSHVG